MNYQMTTGREIGFLFTCMYHLCAALLHVRTFLDGKFATKQCIIHFS